MSELKSFVQWVVGASTLEQAYPTIVAALTAALVFAIAMDVRDVVLLGL
jgi:hypothetical protein